MVAERIDTGEPNGSPSTINADQYTEGLKKVLDLTNDRAVRNPYRHWTVKDMLDQREYWSWYQRELNLRLVANPHCDMSYEGYSAKTNLDAIERELNRRRNIEADSGGRPDIRRNERRSVDFDAVKRMLVIEDVAERFSPNTLEKHGRVMQCRCFLPGHDDNTPSFTVFPHTQTFHCFGCGRGGDVIELACHHFGQDNRAIACEHMCLYLGVEVPRTKDYTHPPVRDGVRGLAPDGTVVEFDPSLFKGKPRRRW